MPTTNHIRQLFRPIILFPKYSLPKFLLCPRTKITFPTLYFVSWHFKEQSGHREPYKYPQTEGNVLSFLSMHSGTSLIHTFTWALPMQWAPLEAQGTWQQKKQVQVRALNKSTYMHSGIHHSKFCYSGEKDF